MLSIDGRSINHVVDTCIRKVLKSCSRYKKGGTSTTYNIIDIRKRYTKK